MNTDRYDENLARVTGRFQSAEKKRKLPQVEDSRCKNKKKGNLFLYVQTLLRFWKMSLV